MQRLTTLLIAAIFALQVFAEKVLVDGLYYEIYSDGTCMVTGYYITRIPSGDFTIPSSIKSGDREYTVTKIGYCAFEGSKLNSVNIPNSITEIGHMAFSQCSSMTSVSIPNSVTKIGSFAFEYCGLTSITIPNSVIEIESWAFRGCRSLTTAIIGNSVANIGEQAFINCNNLSSVAIGESVKEIGKRAFANCIVKKVFITSISNWCDIDFSTFDSNPLWYGANLYIENDRIIDLIIPENVAVIKDYAFYAANINSLKILSRSVKIGYESFSKSALRSIKIQTDVLPDINDFSFYELPNYEVILWVPNKLFERFKNLLTMFKHVAFDNNRSEEYNIKKPGDLINLLDFSEIESITSLKLKGKINGSDFLAINRFVNLVELDLSETSIVSGGLPYYENTVGKFYTDDDHIGSYCVFNLPILNAIKLPKGLKFIDDNAFFYKSHLKEVTLPESLKSIGKSAFCGCNIVSLSIPNSVTKINESAFYNCTILTSVIIGNSVTTISPKTFQNCESLISITIPNSVKSIGKFSFEWCSLLDCITIPSSVTKIGEAAFSYCSDLSAVYVHNPIPPEIESNTFDYKTTDNATLYVPEGSQSSYWLLGFWGRFKKIEPITTGIVNTAMETEHDVHVFVENGEIVISGTTGAVANIYTLKGVKVRSSTSRRISGLSPGMYLVRVEDKVFKVLL